VVAWHPTESFAARDLMLFNPEPKGAGGMPGGMDGMM
jgi:hypothetical protein